MERSMFLLCETDRTVPHVCFDVGFTSPGTSDMGVRDPFGNHIRILPQG